MCILVHFWHVIVSILYNMFKLDFSKIILIDTKRILRGLNPRLLKTASVFLQLTDLMQIGGLSLESTELYYLLITLLQMAQ